MSGQGRIANDQKMTLLIMTLNDNQQLLDVLGTLSPHLQNQNIAMMNSNITPSNLRLKNKLVLSPGLVKDSLILNTQRVSKTNILEFGVIHIGLRKFRLIRINFRIRRHQE